MPYNARTKGYYISGAMADFTTTTNIYSSVGEWSVGHFGTKRLRFEAADNTLNVTIMGSFDGGVTFPIEAEAQFAVQAGPTNAVIKTITDLYTDIEVMVDPAVDDTHGTLSVTFTGWSR